ncbi:helix-turn-helix transcriptional regulator [Vibrio paucivorans]|uniref:AraC family transcriptional regulator n=1 Tax=Vibrio paucivorans TaxID=2829489 RepID=A0A9X3CHC4_9VIBR|nr:AraC family transcriptional regulator [Vibrio paucivorans]MCW8335776.1 AraC family transcriptional regulator [Vibrio paucivorans]
MTHKLQISEFRAQQLQALRNVTIHSPSIIQIISGNKRLFGQEESVTLTPSSLLLSPACASFSFANVPEKGPFLSRVFSFHCSPSQEMLTLSENNTSITDSTHSLTDQAIQETLNALAGFNLNSMSHQTQHFWLMALFQQLAERGALHRIYPSSKSSYSEMIARYLAASPAQEHTLENVAEHFAMSRATLIRKLKQEGHQYRHLLAQVRLNHALQLMQKHHYDGYLLAQMCGYQSEQRFRRRFKDKFGLTPTEYQRTINQNH